ncbi:hypothetical protein BGZ54_004450, partial [Gamsiella multidivaricata]
PKEASNTAISDYTPTPQPDQDHTHSYIHIQIPGLSHQTPSLGNLQDMMMEHPQQPLDLRQFQLQQQQQLPPQVAAPHSDTNASTPLGAMTLSQSLTINEAVHPFHTAPVPSITPTGLLPPMCSDPPTIHPQTTTISQTFAVTSRPLWFDNNGLTHRASFHSLLSAGGKDERLRARRDRGSIISLASTVGDDSPSDFNSLDLDPSFSGDLHSQQSSTGVGYEDGEYDHQGIGTGLAMMSFMDFMPHSHSSPGDTSVEGDLSSTQPSRSNSVMLDPSTVMKVNAMFELGDDSLQAQQDRFNSGLAPAHPLSREALQQQNTSQEPATRLQAMTPGQGPNETEGMLPPLWSTSIEMLSTPVHPFSISPYMDDRSQSISCAGDPTLSETSNMNDREALAQQVLNVYEQEGSRPSLQTPVTTYANSQVYF